MPIPEFEQRRVSQILAAFCDRRVPPHIRNELELRFRFERISVILFERRPAWRRPGEWSEPVVAKFRYFVGRKEWALYWRNRNERWKPYDLIPPSHHFADLLSEVDSDPTGIFWG